ncbi:Non-specific serine/threonine protein kinase [Mycena indigotica]|uniref:Non-specific serine/threonine protein kinase n=1 Tax=Mycena indigotica TaxID=2126181 RepID=A0A8H6W1E7_9AGAR|nr:Non-specific serine/threonine protein kinase [Mycena indigotica]KAF7301472.1 Non-specific serine/threonine protein kinase [Mycena indigotica]
MSDGTNTTTASPPPLPKGAMASTIPSLSLSSPVSPTPKRPANSSQAPSPPATPSQRLLDSEAGHVQFASYPATPDEKTRPLVGDDLPPGWTPAPLRGWYAIALIVLLVCLAIALEIAFHFTNKNNGWKTRGDATNVTGPMHYVYTLPPVIVAAVIVALWTWTDVEIKKMQPYVDLARGDAPPQKKSSFGLHATQQFLRMVARAVQQALGSLLNVKNTWFTLEPFNVNTVATVGLNQSSEFQDLTIFLTAAGYASASVGYNLPEPPFVWEDYTVTPFEIPYNVANNGTLLANVTVVKTNTNCVSVPVTMTNHTDGSGWTNTLSQGGCSFSFVVDHSAQDLFGTSTANCGGSTPPQFLPTIFWFFSYVPSPKSSATYCTPTISLVDALVTLDLRSGNVTNVRELRPFNAATSKFGSLAGNLTGDPLNGRAYNGINFTLNNPDKFVTARMNAIALTMPAAVYQAAVQSSQGVQGTFASDNFVLWSNAVYSKYLTLVAKAVYFLDNREPVSVQIKTFELRLWMSEFAVHALAALFFLLAIVAAVIHVFHRWERQDLNLVHQPGTIASAVAVGAETGMGQLLAQQRDPEGIRQALADKKFRIDPYTNKIVMVGEAGEAGVEKVIENPGVTKVTTHASE